MDSKLSNLNQTFGLGGNLHFRDAGDGFIVADIRNEHCTASLALQGAHLMSWQPDGEEPVLWMSPVASLKTGKSIRGGIPICWPWFGAHATNSAFPAHGFARTVMWWMKDASMADDGTTEITLSMDTVNEWPVQLQAEIKLAIGRTLELELMTKNRGEEAVVLGEALHTYFSVSDVRDVSVHGLDGCGYLDTVGEKQQRTQHGEVVIDREVDRIYQDYGQELRIVDPGMRRALCIEKENSRSTIVWNPWIDKCKRMGDFGSDEGYLDMLCVETANADRDVVVLQAEDSHRLWVRYSIEHDFPGSW